MPTYGQFAKADDNLEGKYVVWNPGSERPVTTTYNNRPDAIKVANLMANRNPGSQFAVCKIVGVARPAKVQYESFDDEKGGA